MNSKISIITINYNNSEGLQKTIDSVIKQTFKNFEFIIVDGGSSDGSKDLLLPLENDIKWISEPDNGIYHAMNKGINMSTGNYLLFLNSGDYLINNDIIGQIDHRIDGNHSIYYSDIIFSDLTGDDRKVIFPEELTFDFFFTNNLSHQATFIKRMLFHELFFYNENFKIVSDWEFLIYAICKQNVSYKHLNIITTIYDGTGLSSNPVNSKLIEVERNITMKAYFPAFITDYAILSQLKEKRVAQFFTIKKYPLAWKILKFCIKIMILFLPKSEKTL